MDNYTKLRYTLLTDHYEIYQDCIEIDNNIVLLSNSNKPMKHTHELVQKMQEQLRKNEECYLYKKPFSDFNLNLRNIINPRIEFFDHPSNIYHRILTEYRVENRKIYIHDIDVYDNLKFDASKSLANLLLTKLHNNLKREAGIKMLHREVAWSPVTNKMIYKDYCGSIEYSDDDHVYHGKIENIDDLVNYESRDREESIRKAFAEAVDDYLIFCKENGKEPNISSKPIEKINTYTVD